MLGCALTLLFVAKLHSACAESAFYDSDASKSLPAPYPYSDSVKESEAKVLHMSAYANGFRPNAVKPVDYNNVNSLQHSHYWDSATQRYNCTQEDGRMPSEGTSPPPEKDSPKEPLTPRPTYLKPLAPPEKISSKSDIQSEGTNQPSITAERDLDVEHAKLVQDINGLSEKFPSLRKSLKEKYTRPVGYKLPMQINDYIENDPLALGADPDELREFEYDAVVKPATAFQTKAPHRFRRPMRHLSLRVRPLPNVKHTTEVSVEPNRNKNRLTMKSISSKLGPKSKHPYSFVRHQPGDLIIVARPANPSTSQRAWTSPSTTTTTQDLIFTSQKSSRPIQSLRPAVQLQTNQLRQQTEQVFQTERPYKRPLTLWEHIVHLFV